MAEPAPASIADVLVAIEHVRLIAEAAKPDDRTATDRRFAVLLTELEKVHAYALLIRARGPHT